MLDYVGWILMRVFALVHRIFLRPFLSLRVLITRLILVLLVRGWRIVYSVICWLFEEFIKLGMRFIGLTPIRNNIKDSTENRVDESEGS